TPPGPPNTTRIASRFLNSSSFLSENPTATCNLPAQTLSQLLPDLSDVVAATVNSFAALGA
ncbi:MAG TPA: hypothetical protein VIM11_24255, partial [Tepidisphaeraceae bacterium]